MRNKDEAPDNPDKNKEAWWSEGGCLLETVSGVFPKGILTLAWGGARPKLLGQQGGVGIALTLRVSGAGASYPGAGVW